MIYCKTRKEINMKIAVLGYVGSGKTYLSDYIAKRKNIPVLHLDEVAFDKEWKQVEKESVLPKVADFISKEDWIIDGLYKYLLIDERLQNADEIILLQLPRMTCFFRVLKRTKERKKAGYKNDLNFWFIKFTLFGCRNKKRRIYYSEIAEKYKDKTVILRTRKQVEQYINSI